MHWTIADWVRWAIAAFFGGFGLGAAVINHDWPFAILSWLVAACFIAIGVDARR